jgi:hypothetical protein
LKNCRVRAGAKRKRDDGDRRKAGTLLQYPSCITEIPKDPFQ